MGDVYLFSLPQTSMRDIRNETGFGKPDSVVMKRLIQLLLIALALFFEVTLFAVVALLVSAIRYCGCRGSSDCANP